MINNKMFNIIYRSTTVANHYISVANRYCGENRYYTVQRIFTAPMLGSGLT